MARDLIEYVIKIEGRVQGVGYRDFTQKTARSLGLRGTVRNLGDGDVEVVAQGPGEALRELLDKLKQGPSGSRIKNIVFTERAIEVAHDSFEVILNGY